MKVLDLGCGDGTTALPAARRGADVLGVDIARTSSLPAMRARAEPGLPNLRFRKATRPTFELADDSFDLVVSIFGAMFAPRPINVAREMVRVTRPGGRIVMGNWIPGRPDARRADPADQRRLHAAAARRIRQPDDLGRRGPSSAIASKLRASPPDNICFDRATCHFRPPGQPSGLLTIFRNFYGPTMNAFDAAEKTGRANELGRELAALFETQNRGGADTDIPATFLKVTVTR